MASDVLIETPGWSFDHPAVHLEQIGARAAPASLAMVRHPTFPFRASIRDDGNDLRPLLFEVARQYVQRVPALATLPLASGTDGAAGTLGFGWLALRWGDTALPGTPDARLSFWVRRRGAGGRQDRTAVLLAGNRVVLDDGSTASAGGSVGLRVVLHVGQPVGGRSAVRVTGLSTAGLESVLATTRSVPRAIRIVDGGGLPGGQDPQQPPGKFDLPALRRNALAVSQGAFGFEVAPALNGIVPTPGLVGEYVISGMGQRGKAGARRVFAWTARLDVQRGYQVLPTNLIEQRSHIIPTEVMTLDPASLGPGDRLSARSPTRPAERLDLFRMTTALLPAAVASRVTLSDARVQVLRSRVGNESTPDAPPPLDVADEMHPLRSDDLSAVHAWTRGKEFFQRLDAFGLDSGDYFRMAKLPLLMRPRASFYYASNGETTNAQVSPTDQGQSLLAPFDPNARPQLQVSFGNANLSHREMLPNAEGRLRAQPLGMAADRRWSWHEFGHVLNFASTGELEFRFAHSAGDALAAITADPDSDLTTPTPVRDLTYPWAMLRRSHARRADLGWCWCGQRSRLRQTLRTEAPPIPGGYFEEELMSSSLFRLYEAIGGALANMPRVRRNASDYVVYLIMRAISLLGPATVVPARTADAFVSALIDADIGTTDWVVKPTWPEHLARLPQRRLGGAVHKVIRWAFERQGLYATDDPAVLHEGPGLPPKVDIYIPGLGDRAEGGYEPVDLTWSRTATMPWHAGATAIVANGANLCRVQVRNRGSDTATGVGARMWVSRASLSVPNWQLLDVAGAGLPADISSAGVHPFSFEQKVGGVLLPRGRYLVLAEVSCDGDLANTAAAAALPCGDMASWALPTLLTHLVANDNNLGLRIVDFN